MSKESIVISVVAEDRPGVTQRLSDVALAHQANWQESSLSQLQGQFAGIVHLLVPSDSRAELERALEALATDGIVVTVHAAHDSTDDAHGEVVTLYVEANDRPGIVKEITAALAAQNVNVVQLETWAESASMAGYELFIAELAVTLPAQMKLADLELALEAVSDDLMVTINPDI